MDGLLYALLRKQIKSKADTNYVDEQIQILKNYIDSVIDVNPEVEEIKDYITETGLTLGEMSLVYNEEAGALELSSAILPPETASEIIKETAAYIQENGIAIGNALLKFDEENNQITIYEITDYIITTNNASIKTYLTQVRSQGLVIGGCSLVYNYEIGQLEVIKN